MATKEIDENGNVYSVDERSAGTAIRLKVDPSLTYTAPPESVVLGETLTVHFQLRDFDGVARSDSRPVTFIIDGEEVAETLTAGEVTIEVECLARGSVTIGVAPIEITMKPFTVQVL